MTRRICIIPARGGSVRIPHKNRRMFHGKPIIEYSIETAIKSRLFDKILVSTDDYEIAKIAQRSFFGANLDVGAAGGTFWRKTKDDGERGTNEIASEVLQRNGDADFACVLYATAPLLTWGDLFVGWQKLQERYVTFAYSVHEDTFEDIGGFYWGPAAAFIHGKPLGTIGKLPIDKERAIDINTEDDWRRAEEMYARLYPDRVAQADREINMVMDHEQHGN